MMLDEMESISNIDKSGMLECLEKFPDQIKEVIEIINNKDLASIFKIDDIVISGMGASAISGDIVQNLFRDKMDIPVFVNREYDLPKWAHKDTLLLSQSYSGNTEETLSTFKHGCQKKCKIIGISSGGKLQEYCEHREIPHIKIPTGLQPRAATAYLLFSSILSLKKIGMLRLDIEQNIEETITITKELIDNIKKSVPEKDNLAKQIARKIFNTTPQIYAFGIYSPIATRWRHQFNENSKVIARADTVSESNHNDIVGWSANPEVSKNFSCILFRDKEEESIYMSTRLDFMKKLFTDNVANIIEICPKGKSRLAKMMYIMCLGDFVSCYLAVLRKIDPTPIDVIIELKESLARI